ncbi:MAG: LysM peptidoglycan-binding domain-containing protein [Chloroflexi bacterium]|nr:LysM peptidoglycan-binding domain-containing protein [Chloroflexota bacterium]
MTGRYRSILYRFCVAFISLLIFMSPAVVWAQPAPAPHADEVVHRVRRGETLATIAARYHTTVAQIAAYNGLRNPNFVYVGQRLRIPVSTTAGRSAAAGLSVAPPGDRRIHIVRRGEYLALIAQRYGTTVQALMRANRLANGNVLYVGQRLVIPGSVSVATQVTPSPTPTPLMLPDPIHPELLPPVSETMVVAMAASTSTPAPPTPAPPPTQVPPTPTPTPIPPTPTSSPTPTATPTPPPTTAAPIASSTAEPASPPASPTPIVHVVQRGEFLASIAQKYGVTVQAILSANRVRNPNLLYAGQRLVIPNGQAPSEARPVPTMRPSQWTDRHPPDSRFETSIEGKWIEVNVTTQTLNAYEGDRLIFSTQVSTGLPATPTVLGRFRIRQKLRAQTMSGPGYYLPNVPYVMYFYAGYALHGTYWHNNFGQPMSHGCVNMRTSEAKWLYEWAPLGTPVVVHR